MQSFFDRFKEVPTHLVQQVNGDASEQGFRHIGENVINGIESHLSPVYSGKGRSGSPLTSCKSILDFGSGLGRIILPLSERAPQAQITGFDIDPLMIKWAKYLFGNSSVSFVSSTFGLPDRSYDLITVISVFTHLDHTSEFWLSELHRLLSDDGLAIVTYQDETIFEDQKRSGLLPSEAILKDKYIDGRGTSEGSATMGTFYTGEYFRVILEKFFVVHRQISRGLFGHQSVTIVSRKDVALDRDQYRLTYAKSLEHEVFELKADADKHRRNTQRHIAELEGIVQEQVGLREKVEARLTELHRQLEHSTRDLEAFTHLLWRTDDERNSLNAKLSAFQGSLAWHLDKPFRKSRARGSEATHKSSPTQNDSAAAGFCYYFYDSPFRIYRESKTVLRGWCIELSGTEITEMRVCIDGVSFPISYGLPASDVLLPNGSVLSECSYGFAAEFTVSKSGRHTFELDVAARGQPWTNLLKVPIWSA